MKTMRAKLVINDMNNFVDDQKNVVGLSLSFRAVCRAEGYPEDGTDENNTFAKWTPTANLNMSITNPALFDSFAIGQEYYVDFTEAN